MNETLLALLWRLSEADEPVSLWGRSAAPFFGPAFQRLLSSGALEERQPATEWEPCPDCSCNADVRIIRRIQGSIRALCPLDAGRDTELSDDDLRSFQVRPERLIEQVSVAIRDKSDPSLLVPGVWLVASGDEATAVAVVPARRFLMQPGLEHTLRKAWQGDLVLLSPAMMTTERLRFTRVGIRLALLREATSISDSGRLSVLIPQETSKPQAHPPLVVYRGARRAVWGEKQIALSDQPTRLLAALIERAKTSRPHLTARDVEDIIYGSSAPATARPGRDMVRELRKALTRGGLERAEIDALIRREGNRGWRLECQGATKVEP